MRRLQDNPPDLRFTEIERILREYINVGNSCAIVGVGSVGKSNLLRLLQRPDVLQFHKDQGNLSTADGNKIATLLVDPHLALEIPRVEEAFIYPLAGSAWHGYEHILYRLFLLMEGQYLEWEQQVDDEALLARGWKDNELFEQIQDKLQRMWSGNNPLTPLLGLRLLEHALQQFFWYRPGSRIVIMFDEFEKCMETMPPAFFQALRGLRDNFKYRLMYIVSSRREIDELAAETGRAWEYESFLELFTDRYEYVGLYDRPDTNVMINRLCTRHGEEWVNSDPRRLLIYDVTDGHAGFVRAVFSANERILTGRPIKRVMEGLLKDPGVSQECETIWYSLSEVAQSTIQAIMADKPISDSDRNVGRLRAKRLIVREEAGMTVAPPIFRAYLEHKFSEMQE